MIDCDSVPAKRAVYNKGLKDQLVEQRVICALEMDGKLYVVENVPVRVDEDTGEQFFAPSTVERLRETILEQAEPSKVIETPVCKYGE